METFISLLAGHLLGDFVCQNRWMVSRKRRPGILVMHVIMVTAVTLILLGTLHWPLLLALFLLHFLLDAVKTYGFGEGLIPFVVDQGLHIVILIGLAMVFPMTVAEGWWPKILGGDCSRWYFGGLSLLSGIILTIPAGGILVGKATRPFIGEIGEGDIRGLEKGGLYIGWLERSLVMLLILINQPAGIGFLIATKSILRFGEIREARQRKIAEYIIIGTFLSFGWALLVSILTRAAIRHWLAL